VKYAPDVKTTAWAKWKKQVVKNMIANEDAIKIIFNANMNALIIT